MNTTSCTRPDALTCGVAKGRAAAYERSLIRRALAAASGHQAAGLRNDAGNALSAALADRAMAADSATAIAAHARTCLCESVLAALADRWPGDSSGIRAGIIPDSRGSQP